MAFPNVLKFAKQHYKALVAGPSGSITVNEWKDDAGAAITLHFYRLSGDDQQAISAARRDYGERGEMALTVARSCYVYDGAEKRRAFVDTDLPDLLKSVDFQVLSRVYFAVIESFKVKL